MSLTQLAQGAARGALGRSFLIEKRADGLPRVITVFDAITAENPEYEADVTLLPVEEGEEVTDHIQLKNPVLKLDGTISQTPLDLEVQIINLLAGGLEAATSEQSRANFLNSAANTVTGVAGASLLGNAANPLSQGLAGLTDSIARSSLLSAYERRARFTVVTKRHQYTNMVIKKMSFPRDNRTGDQLIFSLVFQKIRVTKPVAATLTSIGDSVVNSAAPEVNQGAQVSKVANAAQNKTVLQSELSKFIGSFQ